MNAADLYHVGIVTDDLDTTRDMLSSLFGYEWPDEIGGPTLVCLNGIDTTVDLRIVYSRTTPRVELVRAVPETLWVPAQDSGIHHVGYWSDDVEADAHELEQAGFITEATGRLGDAGVAWTFQRAPHGPRIELVSRALQGPMDQYWA